MSGLSSSSTTSVGGLVGVAAGATGVVDEVGIRLRRDLWRTAVPDAVVEHRIEVRRYGPVQTMLVAGQPAEPRFNLLLGAARPHSVEHGHLADASEAVRALGVDHHVPVISGLDESEAAEDWLDGNGYRPRGRRACFVRDATLPDLPEPAAIEVDELTDYEAEGECFSSLIVEAFELNLSLATFFFELPGKANWRCYAAIDDDEAAVGCGAMWVEDGIALLAFDSTHEASRGRGCQTALLRRRIVDAAAAGCHAIVAETDEPLDDGDGDSVAARNLRRAGFERVALGAVWGP